MAQQRIHAYLSHMLWFIFVCLGVLSRIQGFITTDKSTRLIHQPQIMVALDVSTV